MSFRVMTYNILDNGRNREPYILDVIQNARPNVVILQEVFTEGFLQYLSRELHMKYYFGTSNHQRKVALLSGLPIRSFKNYHPFPIWRNVIEAEVEYEPNRTIRVFGVHPVANLGIIFEVWRLWEATYVANCVQSFENQLCLLAGDFNAIAPGEITRTENMTRRLRWIIYLQGNRVYHFSIRRLLSQGLTDCFRDLHPGDEGYTLPTTKPNARLDYIFVNAKMKKYLSKCWVLREPQSVNLASDHYPIMAEFNLPMEAGQASKK